MYVITLIKITETLKNENIFVRNQTYMSVNIMEWDYFKGL
jgi:hypothetical protein